MRKTGQWHTRRGRGEMAEYPLTAQARLRMKRAKAFTEAQDRLTGFERDTYYARGGEVTPVMFNGEQYYVVLHYDNNTNPASDWDMCEVVRKDRLPSDADRGDWCDDPSPGHWYSDEVIVLSEDMRVQQRAEYLRAQKYGKAWAWDIAVLHRNASLEYAKKWQKGDVTIYGVVVTNEEGQEESLWGVEEECIAETVRDLINQF